MVEFILLGIPWDSLICEFLSFTQFGTFSGILSSNISFCTYVSFYLLGWNSDNMNFQLFEVVPGYHSETLLILFQ